ncbi:Methionine aminopeptidase 1 [Lacunisphaera limnophila]|uniref:Methionine aminopeptidase n=1 Tax=Lacunisphaera limnophila TaxID=1838286 RepID=A0A1D8ARA2_9BACT|nr:type I methionyl aminopeptidase [Lacunisphaera limnophila]AOS43410.1 Methionine aminopeptidase 1 [Lacunisphaera limnophila]
MIPIKNSDAIKRMRESCAIAATVLARLKAQVRPGITTYDLDQIGRDLIASFGARSACHGYQLHSRRYPAYTCLSVNEEVVHGIGSLKRILRDGDVIALDVVVEYDGYVGDNATTVAVGAIAPRTAELLAATEEALAIGIRQAQVGNRIGDISHAIQTFVEARGFGVVREMVGHGVGREMHEEPQIPNFGRKNSGEKIKAGMTLAIEPMVNLGSYRVRTLADGWTVVTADGSPSAHFEHTVLTTDSGPEILTIPRAT